MEFGKLNITEKENIIIRNGFIVNPGTKEKLETDVLILGGIVKEIKKNIHLEENILIRELNASGLYICPWFIDMHVHLRDPGDTA